MSKQGRGCGGRVPRNRERWDRHVQAFLASDSPCNSVQHSCIRELWSDYLKAELPTYQFVCELTNGRKATFHQRCWEMLLARHLIACGHSLPPTPDQGPDFVFGVDGYKVWVEATSPEPKDLQDNWLNPQKNGVFEVPHKEIVLRWTSAFKAKSEQFAQWLKDGTIGHEDSCVVAINGSQLSHFPLMHGLSRRPYAVETVFPIGPLGFQWGGEPKQFLGSSPSEQFSVTNVNGAAVEKIAFLTCHHSHISALVGYAGLCDGGKYSPLCVVYNPFATAPIARGYFGAEVEEFEARPVDGVEGEWNLVNITNE